MAAVPQLEAKPPDRTVTAGRDALGNVQLVGSDNSVSITIYQTVTAAEPIKPGPAEGGERAAEFEANPYKGLAYFTEQDADCYFGREELIDTLRDRLQDLLAAPSGGDSPLRILPILGPSGSGKSSAARAGLIPALARDPVAGMSDPRIAVLTPGTRPLEALASILATIVTGERASITKEREFERELAKRNGDNRYDALRRIAASVAPDPRSHLIVLVDQFEEAYSLCDDRPARDAFIGNLVEAASDPDRRVSVILTLRSDFLAETQAHEALNKAIAKFGVIVPAMGREQLERAIAEPALARGHPIDDATVQLLVDSVAGRAGALPLLQFALERIWEGMAEGVAPSETLHQIDGVGGALAASARTLFSRLDEDQQQIAKRAFLQLVRLGEGTRDTRRRARLQDVIATGETDEAVRMVIDRFADPDQRLITVSSDPESGVVVEVTHEALFEHWTDLRDWLDENRDDIRLHRRLEDVANRWDGRGRPEGMLWRPPELDRLRQFFSRAGEELTQVQTEFFQESDQKDRRGRQLKVAVVAAIALLAVVASVFGLYARNQQVLLSGALNAVEVQLQETKRKESLMLAGLSVAKTKEGDAVTGARLALHGLPRGQDAEDRPFIAPTYAALYSALHAQDERAVLRGHEGGVRHVAFSVDGTRVVTAALDGTARLWDARSRQQIAVLRGHEAFVQFAAFNSDGTRVVTASKDGTARLWDVGSGEEVAVLRGHENAVKHAGFSPDGTRVVTASGDRTARLWDASSGKPVAVLRGHKDAVRHAMFSPDGARVVTVSGDRTARLWDARSGQSVAVLRGHEGSVQSAAISPDGTRMVTASGDGTARLWDLRGGKPLAVLRGHEKFLQHAAFNPDGTRVLTASGDGTARLWDAQTGAMIAVLRGHEDFVEHAAFSPDGTRVVTASWDRTARLWDAANGQALAVLRGHEDYVWRVAFSPDGRRLATASRDGTVRFWDAGKGDEVAVLQAHEDFVRHAAFDPDGSRVVTTSGDKTARLWDSMSGEELAVLRGHESFVEHATFSPDGTRVVTASGDKTARVWNARTGDALAVLRGHRSFVKRVAFSPDGTRVLTASGDKTARLWDAASGAQLAVLRGHERSVWHAAFSPDGTRIVTTSMDKTARLWDAASGEELAVLRGHGRSVRHAAFSPDGSKVVTASGDKTARLWDARTGALTAVLNGHEDFVRQAVFSPDGTLVVTASGDKTARLWDVASGESLGVLRGHESFVEQAVFSPDGTRIVTASMDGTARLWDVESGQTLVVLRGHENYVWHAAFSPDGTRIVTASEDKSARTWNVLPYGMELVAYAERTLPRALTAAQEVEFFLREAGE